MSCILVAWEDTYYEPLFPFVERRLAALAPPNVKGFPQLRFHTARGNGSFDRYVRLVWPLVRANGLPRNPGSIDHLICVVDGDRVHEHHEDISRPPTLPDEVTQWYISSEQAWENHLRDKCRDSAPPGTVHGLILRWSKESLLLAGYDREPLREHLGIDLTSDAVQAFLARCQPLPADVADCNFTDTYRHPWRCLSGLRNARGLPVLSKNCPEMDDALRALAGSQHRATLYARVPDIDLLTRLIWKLETETSRTGETASKPDS